MKTLTSTTLRGPSCTCYRLAGDCGLVLTDVTTTSDHPPPVSHLIIFVLRTLLTSKIEPGTFYRYQLRWVEVGEPDAAKRSNSYSEARGT